MNLNFVKDPQAYLLKVEDLLLEKESCNNLMLGIINQLAEGQSAYKDVNLGIVEKAGNTVFAFMQTPPNNWIFPDVEVVEKEVSQEIAKFLFDEQLEVPGILGPDQIVQPFVKEWEKLNNVESTIHMEQLIYQMDKVNSVSQAEGELRKGTKYDHKLLTEWLIQFGREANEIINRDDADFLAVTFIKNSSVYLWQVNGKPVSMVNRSRKTKNGATINAVYTPDEYKRKGYATSSVAALSRKLLADGSSFCSLYTDANYPDSNRIYKRIGYYEVGTSIVYEFNRDSHPTH
ncbi:GNAT family N-acetyltransferase [Virgibacillus sp. DJP39]|uniref:GNAT family N-acetyltransferase n=1 Tax=Virgibacillus sp. DJP39 TaxID=3409790 RepID=UPI003BB5C01F